MNKIVILLSICLFAYANSYKVVGISSDDTLSIRKNPGTIYEKIGELPYNAKNIEVLDCVVKNSDAKWCFVKYKEDSDELKGWVSFKYLSKQDKTSSSELLPNYVYENLTKEALIDAQKRWVVIKQDKPGKIWLVNSYGVEDYAENGDIKANIQIFIDTNKRTWSYSFKLQVKTNNKKDKVTSYRGASIKDKNNKKYFLQEDSIGKKKFRSKFYKRRGEVKTLFSEKFNNLDYLYSLKHGKSLEFHYRLGDIYDNNFKKFIFALNNFSNALETAYKLADKEKASKVKTTTIKQNKKNLTQLQQKKECLKKLEDYFVKEVSHEELKQFLLAQYEITMAKSLAIIFQIYLYDVKLNNQNKSIFSPTLRYISLVRNHIFLMDAKLQADPEFQKAKQSFLKDPLSVKSFSKIIKFLSTYADNKGLLKTNYGADFRLKMSDFKMFDILIAHEKKFGKKSTRLMIFLNGAHKAYIYNRDMVAMEKVSFEEIVKPNEDFIKNFLEKIHLSLGCRKESKDNLYALFIHNENIENIIFQSILKRDDLNAVRREKFLWPIFHYGKYSPWGSYVEQSTRAPILRDDPENISD